jgi:hypothetical protein
MSLLAKAYYDRHRTHKPRMPTGQVYQPYYSLYGRLPGWVANLLRQTFTDYRNI